MKKFYILAAILFFNSFVMEAQTESVLDPTGTGITGFLIVGNELYYTQSDDILKIDITTSSATPVLIVNGLSEPTGLLLNGNDLYFAQATANKVSKIDITASSPTIIDVVTGLNEPTFMALKNNDLYISEIGAGKISKVDITASLPITTTTLVAENLITPLDLELIGNDLYIAEPDGNKISKINIASSLPITATTVATGLNKPLQLTLNGNDLYIVEKNGNKISKIDITSSTPTIATDVLTGLGDPEVIASNSSHLYFSQNSATVGFAKIDRLSFSSLSIDDNFSIENLSIYPNPTMDYILISDFSKNKDYVIYNVSGAKVLSGTVLENNKIDVRKLKSGMYFFTIDNSVPIKFIKE